MIKHPKSHSIFTALLFMVFSSQLLAQDQGFSHVGIASDLRDISASGTGVLLGDDEVSAAFPIGFTFNFYGNDYTAAYISSNGFITFSSGQSDGCCTGQDIPVSSNPNNLVAGFWEDLNSPQGNIRYETLGAQPNREFVVGYYDVPHWLGGVDVTFEIVLHEDSNNVEFQYGDAPSDGGTHTVGVENEDGTLAYLVDRGNISFSDEGFLLIPELIEFVPVPTLRSSMLITLALMLGLFGLLHVRRKNLVV